MDHDRRDVLGRALASEVFSYGEPDRLFQTIRNILIAMLVGAAATSVFALVVGWPMSFRIAAATTVCIALLLLLHRAGYPRLAGVIVLLVLWFAPTYSAYSSDGTRDIAVIVYPAVILVGSLMLRTRYFVVLTLMVLGSYTTIGALEIRGVVANRFSDSITPATIIVFNILIGCEAVVVRLLTRMITISLASAHHSEQNYREIFNATGDAIFLHDATTGIVLDVNEATLGMLGYERGEILGMGVDSIVSADAPYDAAGAFTMINKAIEQGPQVVEWRARRKNGEEFWVEVALRSTQIGGKGRILAVVRDVDERKKFEERLRQSEKLEAVGLLAGGIAHDFNNQLTGIVGNAELLLEEAAPGSETAESAQNILLSARRAAELTSQLLAYARKGKYESRAVDIHRVVGEVVSLLRHSIDKKIVITTDLAAETATIEGDPSQLHTALLNLALNARDAMPDGGTLTLRTRITDNAAADAAGNDEELPAGDYVELSVSDTGTGIDSDVQARIFEPFFTTKPEGEGTGMGLAAVYGTVKNHKGTITVSSRSGRGTTFYIRLPLSDRPSAPEPDRTAPPETTSTRGSVLVIDDEPTVCQLSVRMLQVLGHTADSCLDPAEAIEKYRRGWRDIDLIVLDMSMPGMGGREVFRALRDINPAAVIVLASGFDSNEEIQGLLAEGAAGFLQKPFRKDDFAQVVSTALASLQKNHL